MESRHLEQQIESTPAAPPHGAASASIAQWRIFYVGQRSGNSESRLQGMRKICADAVALSRDPFLTAPRWLRSLEWRLLDGPATRRLNRMIVKEAVNFKPDVLWTEMGRLIFERTLVEIRDRTGATLVNSFSDDFKNPIIQSRHYDKCIRRYDHIFTPREQNFDEMKHRGARSVSKFWKGFDPGLHKPVQLTADEQAKFGADVVFVGHAEPNRIETLSAIAELPINFKVWGYNWEKYTLPDRLRRCVNFERIEGPEYVKALCGAKIAIHMVSKINRDTQSSKSFEIPACGVFMLADRTADHEACYVENEEAAFFSTIDELVEKTTAFLKDDAKRKRIAAAGRDRCIRSGYSNHDRIRQMLELTFLLRSGR
ncbi:MAG: glycosyltransferase [Phycisphaerales bacterium]|nr:glycosyltransferase [Phycisphaerales bacterium]MCB9854172.1 glycosyltransferase [Phycisphaerales bacterium]MCB9864692.1 glycosyltransferase [Phycisphaerales bacterium]